MKTQSFFKRIQVCFLLLALLLPVLVPAFAATTYPYDTQSIESVRLRKSASSNAVVIANISAGDTVTILGVTGSYYKISFNGKTGYAMKKYIDGTSNAAESGPSGSGNALSPGAIDSYPYDTTTIDRVKLRKSASETAAVLLVVPQGESITVLDVTNNGFAKVKFDGKTGYLMSAYVNLANIPTPTPIATPTPDLGAAKYTELKSGDAGSAVRALQEALTELLFYTGTVDSKYGGQTKQAVIAFQKKNKMKETGIADGALQKLLYEGKPKNTKGTQKKVKTLAPLPEMTIKSGNTGELVERMQTRLWELGYYTEAINGVCDKKTIAAIKAFQEKHELDKTGIADPKTQNVLYGATAMRSNAVVTPAPTPTVAPPQGTVRKGDKGDDVKAVQQQLSNLGYYKGKIDGTFGQSSVEALQAFQEKSGLSSDGVCGDRTRLLLFSTGAAYAVATAVPPVATVLPSISPDVLIIKAGSRGNDVLQLQKRLAELGYYTSRLDGMYLEDDISAVRSFQSANGLKIDGKAGYETQSKLFSEAAVRGNAIDGSAGLQTLRYGDKNAAVTTLQTRLIELNYLTGAADGNFGVSTKAAVVAFQKANKLTADGVAGTKTLAALTSSNAASNKVTADDTLKEGMANASVRDLQNRLIALGYLSGTADGKFGAKTSLALIEFQKRNSLTADGVAGSKTIAKLNSSGAKLAPNATATPKPGAPTVNYGPNAAEVRYANWYSEVKARCRLYPNATIYDFTTGISWQVNMFSLGAHADAEPLTSTDTANMNRAFGKTTWNPKAVWVMMSDGRIYLASTHNTPHDPYHIRTNNFNGHICIHFPRTDSQVASIGPYATSHQKAIDLGWQGTLSRIGK